jgi:hypothetical protein
LSQLPDLSKWDYFAAWFVGCATPGFDVGLRPEEHHRRSGVNEVVVPDVKWDREMDDETVIGPELTVLNRIA